MSVLYKALQKAEKENELRQSASESGFDPSRLAASGALKATGGRGLMLNRVAMAAIFIVAVGGGVAFVMFQDSLIPPAGPQVASAPPPAPSVMQPPAAAELAGAAPTAPAPAAAPVTDASQPAQPSAPVPAEPNAAETQVASAPSEASKADAPKTDAPKTDAPKTDEPKADPSKPAASRTPQKPEAMPTLAANSPARMLSPPISISRSEFALAGVGNQVTVREVSKTARSNAAAGYDALIRGSYDMALGFYDDALKEEPSSILALLGRGAALQKLGRGQDAQGAYESVLKLDPENREALTNLTTVAAERAPQEALARLLDLERQYATFSPIKAQIGLAYAKLGSLPQALDYFRRALALAPDTVMYQYNMALVLDHLGRRDQAVASYERVLASISGGRGPIELSATEIERRVRFLRAR
ncbi:MAG: tetratricopeptide repeat protein [Rhodospirillaceae bacterium]|nr:tetratricopeptide repeat protein [Rhodospirillaceae bacterium]